MAVLLFGVVGVGLAASSFTDSSDDANEAPDVVSVSVSQSAEGAVSVAVTVDNFESLPDSSWINLWFDLDSNPDTGDAGDEALVRYSADGTLEFLLWNGSQLAAQPVTGMTASFDAGVLSVTVPAAAFSGDSSFGILAVASRGQGLGAQQLIASDFAPDEGRSPFVGPAEMAFPDAGHDHHGAPDLTSIDVSDAKNGWVTFAISTPNYAELPSQALIGLLIDRDNRRSTGDDGVELALSATDGDFLLERWDPNAKGWVADRAPTRVRVRSAANVVTIDIHVSELENTPRFAFGIVAADVDARSEAVLGIDLAPNGSQLYRYRLANTPALLLMPTMLTATPTRPRAGKPFSINLAVRRSDTSRMITSGSVTCRVLVGGRRVPAKGAVSRGAGHCRLVVPAGASGKPLRATITVRAGGKSVSEHFSGVVR